MKHNLIKTDNYLLMFGKLSEIKEGDWYKTPLDIYSQFNGTEKLPVGTKRVVAHLPLNDSPYIDGLDVLPSIPQEDDVDSICMKDLQDFFGTDIHLTPKGEEYISIFKTVYNKCREKYKFTEEDMLQAAKYGYEFRDTTSFPEHNFEDSCINNTKQWLKSRQQPKYPIAFECEVEPKFKHIGSTKEVKGSGSRIKNKYAGNPKTFINFDGRSEWVGKYIYE
jgi:hypothetical protein